jgi:hypothetical protein
MLLVSSVRSLCSRVCRSTSLSSLCDDLSVSVAVEVSVWVSMASFNVSLCGALSVWVMCGCL